jgi:hypothetical protein
MQSLILIVARYYYFWIEHSASIQIKIKGDTMAALPMIAEEIVSEVLVVFEFFHFMWALLMEVVSMF